MSARALVFAYLPLALILVVFVVTARWKWGDDRRESWWTSPRRRAEVAEAHPYVGTMTLMFLVASPFFILALLQGRSVGSAALFWVELSVIGTAVTWTYVWRMRRRRTGD